jgi:hypothetical protein
MMRRQPLVIPLLLDASEGENDALPIEPIHMASWQSLEPSTSATPPLRRVALACVDNTIWITSLEPAAHDASPGAPQLVVPTDSAPVAGGSRTPTSSRNARPCIPRSSSFVQQHRASSSASSILSSASRRRTSAFSPPPTTALAASVTTTTASADVLAGHEHPQSDRDLLDHLRQQQGANHDDGRLGLGIAGLGRRGLSGVHSKEEISQSDGGAVSPRSSSGRSADSGRTISTRLKGWVGEDERTGTEKQRKELMERMQEVEVEREMLREVDEERRELEEERSIEMAKRSHVGTPSIGSESRLQGTVRRIVLRSPASGRIVQLKADEPAGILLVLRDIG